MRGKTKDHTNLPHLTYNGGKLIENVEIYSVFWGEAWNNPPYKTLSEDLNTFLAYLVKSELFNQLQEYKTKSFKIDKGSFIGTINIGSSAQKEIDNKAIKKRILIEIKNKTFVKPTKNTLYVLFFPPGLIIKLGNKKSCDVFCGYHESINNKIIYTVIPYLDCPICRNNLSLFDAYTVVISHEISEVVTNPFHQTGWYSMKDSEIGDICLSQTKKLGRYIIQKEWSNKQKACV